MLLTSWVRSFRESLFSRRNRSRRRGQTGSSQLVQPSRRRLTTASEQLEQRTLLTTFVIDQQFVDATTGPINITNAQLDVDGNGVPEFDTIVVDGPTIDGTGGAGININISDLTLNRIVFSGLTIEGTQGSGVDITLNNVDLESIAFDTNSISSTLPDGGIDIDLTDVRAGELAIFQTTVNGGNSTGVTIDIASQSRNTVIDEISIAESSMDGLSLTSTGRLLTVNDGDSSNPLVRLTIADHGLQNGTLVSIEDVVGLTEANTRDTITVIDDNIIELNNTSSAGGFYQSGGTVTVFTELNNVRIADSRIAGSSGDDGLVISLTDTQAPGLSIDGNSGLDPAGTQREIDSIEVSLTRSPIDGFNVVENRITADRPAIDGLGFDLNESSLSNLRVIGNSVINTTGTSGEDGISFSAADSNIYGSFVENEIQSVLGNGVVFTGTASTEFFDQNRGPLQIDFGSESAETTIDGAINATTQTIRVVDGSAFQPQQVLLVEDEIVFVSAIDGNDLTVVRGERGTLALAHADGATVRSVTDSRIGARRIISGNTINGVGAAGLFVDLPENTSFNADIEGNTFSNNTLNAVDIAVQATSAPETIIRRGGIARPTLTTPATTLRVEDASVFSRFLTPFEVQVEGEVMTVTAVDGNDLTVVRGANATQPLFHGSATRVVALQGDALHLDIGDAGELARNRIEGNGGGIDLTLEDRAGGSFNILNNIILTSSSATANNDGIAINLLSVDSEVEATNVLRRSVIDGNLIGTEFATTLPNALNTTLTVFNVDDASGFTAGQTVRVDDETMTITAINGNTLTVTRGVAGTVTDHAEGATIMVADGGSDGRGIDVFWEELSVLEDFQVTNNIVANQDDDGIRFRRVDDGISRTYNPVPGQTRAITINDNVVVANAIAGSDDGAGPGGIEVQALNGTLDTVDVTINGNVVVGHRSEPSDPSGINLRAEADARIEADIIGNQLRFNDADGIHLTQRSNSPTDLRDISAFVFQNTISDNDRDGINIDIPVGGTSLFVVGREGTDSNGLSLGNDIQNNGEIGIHFNNGSDGSLASIASNRITNNGRIVPPNPNAGGAPFAIDQPAYSDASSLGTEFIPGSGIKVSALAGGSQIAIKDNDLLDNAGAGIDINTTTFVSIRENFITGNQNDGIETTGSVQAVILGNFIGSNVGRGLDILVAGDTANYKIGDGLEAGRNRFIGNQREGLYYVSTADTSQDQNVNSSVALATGGGTGTTSNAVLQIDTNTIEDNGIGTGFSATGLVMRVGSSGGGGGPATAYLNATDTTNGIGTIPGFGGNSRSNISITDNSFDGNFGDDIRTETYVSTVNPATTTQEWGSQCAVNPPPVQYHLLSYDSDPLARINMVLTGNSGNGLEVRTVGGAYSNAEPVFKSRDAVANGGGVCDASNTPYDSAGPFGTGGTRGRSIINVPSRTGLQPSTSPFFTPRSLNTTPDAVYTIQSIQPVDIGNGQTELLVTLGTDVYGFYNGVIPAPGFPIVAPFISNEGVTIGSLFDSVEITGATAADGTIHSGNGVWIIDRLGPGGRGLPGVGGAQFFLRNTTGENGPAHVPNTGTASFHINNTDPDHLEAPDNLFQYPGIGPSTIRIAQGFDTAGVSAQDEFSQGGDFLDFPGVTPWEAWTPNLSRAGAVQNVATAPGGGIQITAPNHNLGNGRAVQLSEIDGVPAANGTFLITVTGPNTFTIPGVLTSAYQGGGLWATVDDSFPDPVVPTFPLSNIIDVTPDPRTTNSGVITFDFTEDMTGVDIDDLFLIHDGIPVDISRVAVQQTSPSQYTVDLSNETSLEGQYELIVDAEFPQATIVPVSPDPRIEAVDQVTVNFSENVTGVDIFDFTLSRDLGDGQGFQPIDLSEIGANQAVTQVTPSQYTLNFSEVTGVEASYRLELLAPRSLVVNAININTNMEPVLSAFNHGLSTGQTITITALVDDMGNSSVLNGTHRILVDDANSIRLVDSTLTSPTQTTETFAAFNAVGGATTATFTYDSGIVDRVGRQFTVTPAGVAADATEFWVHATEAPTGEILDIQPDPRLIPVDTVQVQFSEPVLTSTISSTDFRMTVDVGSGGIVPLDLSGVIVTPVDVATSSLVGSLSGVVATSTLAGGITAIAPNLVVADATQFPAIPGFDIQINNEHMRVTAIAGNVFTVTRGVNGTTAAAHNFNATVSAATVVTVLDATSFPKTPGFDLLIDSEELRVIGVSGNSFAVIRGVNGSTIAAHASGTTVREFGLASLYELSNLATLTSQAGDYRLTLISTDSTPVRDATGNPLVFNDFEDFTVVSTGPLPNIVDVTRDPRDEPASLVVITFSEPITNVDLANAGTHFTLTRDANDGQGPQNVPLIDGTGTPLPIQLSGSLMTIDLSPVTSQNGLATGPSIDGTYTLTLNRLTGITSTIDGEELSVDAVDIWVQDSVDPTADILDLDPDPRAHHAGVVTVVFSEPVTGVDVFNAATDFTLTRDIADGNGAQPVNLSGVRVRPIFPRNRDGLRVLPFLGGELFSDTYVVDLSAAGLTDVPGDYVLTLTNVGNIADATDNPYAPNADSVEDWQLVIKNDNNVIQDRVFTQRPNPLTLDSNDVFFLDQTPPRVAPSTLLATGINATQTTLTVLEEGVLSGTDFNIHIGTEQLRVTNVSGTTLTVERGVEGTTAASHNAGDTVSRVLGVDPDPRSTAVGVVTIRFTEPVTGFNLSDLQLTRDDGAGPVNVPLTGLTLNQIAADEYTIDLNLTTGAPGTYVLSIQGTGSLIEDSAGNPIQNGEIRLDSWVVESIGPTADVDVTPEFRNTTTANNTIRVTFTKDIEAAQLDASDFLLQRDTGEGFVTVATTLTGAVITPDTGNAFEDGFTLDLSATGLIDSIDGTYRLTLQAADSDIVDQAGIELAANASDTWVLDNTLPVADIIDIAPDPRAEAVGTVNILFTEAVVYGEGGDTAAGIDITDFTLTRNGGAVDISGLTVTQESALRYTINLSSVTTQDGTYDLQLITDNPIQDLAGNELAPVTSNIAAQDLWFIGADVDAPTVTITEVGEASDVATPRARPVGQVRLTFAQSTGEEDVSNVDISDVTLTLDGNPIDLSGVTVQNSAGSLSEYVLDLSDVTVQNGTYVLRVLSSDIQDLAGNALQDTVSAGVADEVTWETQLLDPSASFVPVTPDPRLRPVGLVTLNFTQDVTGPGVDPDQFRDAYRLTRTVNGGDPQIVSLRNATLEQSPQGPDQYFLDLTRATGIAGTYTLRLVADDSGIVATGSGDPLTSDAVETWTTMTEIVVNSTSDTIDINPGDGTAADAGGNVSLRAAIMEANALPGDDTIILGAGTYNLTIAGINEDFSAAGDLDIRDTTGSLTIVGAGADVTTIDASSLERVFHVFSGATFDISGVTIQGGRVTGSEDGGGIRSDGATVTITDSVITGNASLDDAGAINNTGNMTLTRVTISNNTATNTGGAIRNSGILTISESTIGGTFDLADPMVQDLRNRSGQNGGAIINLTDGNLTLLNSTISGNETTGGLGGGLFNFGRASLSNVTIASNHAAVAGGGVAVTGGLLELRNTLIADNTVDSAAGQVDVFDFTAGGSISSQSSNLIGNNTGATAAFPTATLPNANGDFVGTAAAPIDPLLGPLADNGGPTLTQAISIGSTAIDNGGITSQETDQRGITRDLNGVDIGAFEFGGFFVNSTADSIDINPGDGIAADAFGRTTLRAAVMESNALTGANAIQLGSETYTFDLTELDSTAPTADIIDVVPDPLAEAALMTDPIDEITVTFSEPVQGLDLANPDNNFDLLFDDGTGAVVVPLTGVTLRQDSDVQYTLENLTTLLEADGEYELRLLTGSITDFSLARNTLEEDATAAAAGIAAFDVFVRGADIFAPSATLTDIPDTLTGNPGPITLQFDENVVGVDLSVDPANFTLTYDDDLAAGPNPPVAVNLSNVALQQVSLSEYVLNLAAVTDFNGLTDPGEYTLTFDGSATTILDFAGNTFTGTLSDTWIVQPDTVSPTADIVDITPDPRIGSVDSPVQVIFDEAVTGVDLNSAETDFDLFLDIDGFGTGVPATQISLSAVAVTQVSDTEYSLDLSMVTVADGIYRLVLTTDGNIEDLADTPNPLVADPALAANEAAEDFWFTGDRLATSDLLVRPADLTFNGPVPGTIQDQNGTGTGFTHRLPGTGTGLATNDANLTLQTSTGELLVQSTNSAFAGGGANLPTAEAPGIFLPAVGQSDISTTTTLRNATLAAGDRVQIYVGSAAGNVVRAGLTAGGAVSMDETSPINGDRSLLSSPAFTNGDDIELTFARTDGLWTFSWNNLTDPAMSGSFGPLSLPTLDSQAALYAGIYVADSGTAFTATVDEFTVTTNQAPAAFGDLDVTQDTLLIFGNGAGTSVINANAIDRGFDVFSGAALTLDNLTLTNGSVDAGKDGGAIRNEGRVTVIESTISASTAGANGGGIFTDTTPVTNSLSAVLTASDPLLTLNDASAFPTTGDFYILIGSEQILVSGVSSNTFSVTRGVNGTSATAHALGETVTLIDLTVVDSTIGGTNVGDRNTADFGGGIYNDGGVVALGTVDLQGNEALTDGGGFYNDRSATVSITGGTISGNMAGRDGAGLYNNDVATATVNDSTIAANFAVRNGGGLFNEIVATIDLANSRLAANSADEGGGVYNEDGRITFDGGSIIANTAVSDGGGVLATSSAITTLDGTTLSGNVSGAHGGAINNDGTLTITDALLAGNSATANGGAITNTRTLNVSVTSITGNTSSGSGGGFYNADTGSLNLSDVTVSGNTASQDGGGVANTEGATLSVSETTLSGNTSGARGGGLFHDATVTASLTNSTLSANVAVNGGGVSTGNPATNSGALTIANVTISGNTATVSGGGLHNTANAVTVTNATIVNNEATTAGGGVFNSSIFTPTRLKNTIVARNTAVTGPDVNGLGFSDQGNNLIGDGTSVTTYANGVNGNLVGTTASPIDPLLSPLQNNGGETFTHALLFGSPARDTGNNVGIGQFDQRGFDRTFDGDGDGASVVDIGAFESGLTVNSFLDTVDVDPGDRSSADADGNSTLRAAIMEANALTGADSIVLLPGTYTLTIAGTDENDAVRGDLDITEDLTIIGAGVGETIIDANGLDRVFHVLGGATLNLMGVTVVGGDEVIGGGFLNQGRINFLNSAIGDSVLGGNTADLGGGIYNATTSGLLTTGLAPTDAIVTVSNIEDFPRQPGFSILINGEELRVDLITLSEKGDFFTVTRGFNGTTPGTHLADDTVTLVGTARIDLLNTTVTNNEALLSGGGIFNDDELNVNQSTVSNNFAGVRGGGIYNTEAVTISESTLDSNRAEARGGAIYNEGTVTGAASTITISQSTLSNNDAGALGGAIYNSDRLTTENTTISGNMAGGEGGAIYNTGIPQVTAVGAMVGLTIVVDFIDASEAPFTDALGRQVGAFDVASFGFAASQFDFVAQSIVDRMNEHYHDIPTVDVDARSPIPMGQQLAIDFVVGDFGAPPSNGATEFYVLTVGSDLSGSAPGGEAGLSVVRDASGAGPNFGLTNGGLIGATYSNVLQGLSYVPANALSSGNITFTANAIGGVSSHEVGHSLSLLHLNNAGSVTPNGLAPVMSTPAIDAPPQLLLPGTEFAFSGQNNQAGGATQMHVQQLVGAVGLRDAPSSSLSSGVGFLSLTNTTIVNNSADLFAGGVLNNAGSTAELRNTIVAANSVNTESLLAADNDVRGSFDSQSANFIGDVGSASGFVDGFNRDQVGSTASPLDPVFGALQNNGGLTETHALLVGSTAIDNGDNSGGEPIDQRNGRRPTDTNADIGAFEVQDNRLIITDVTKTEGGTGSNEYIFNVLLQNSTAEPITVDFTTVQDTARAGEDFLPVSGTLEFNPGDLVQTITVIVNGDSTPEDEEQFFLQLSNPVNATLLDAVGVGTIQNDDAVVNIDDQQSLEGDGASTTLDVAVDATATTVTLADASVLQPLDPSINPVVVRIGTEDLQVTAISGNDLTVVRGFNGTTAAAHAMGESVQPLSAAIFTVTLSKAIVEDSTIDFTVTADTATSGVDYIQPAAGTLSYSAGETSKTITVYYLGDTTSEAHETFNVTLSNAIDATGDALTVPDDTAVGTILNDDVSLSVAFNLTGADDDEGTGGLKDFGFEVSLANPVGIPITVDVQTVTDGGAMPATSGTDFVALANETLTIPAELTNTPVTVTQNVQVVSDSMFEGGTGTFETFQLGFVTGSVTRNGVTDTGAVLGANAVGQIEDDEPRPIVWTISLNGAGDTILVDRTDDLGTVNVFSGAVATTMSLSVPNDTSQPGDSGMDDQFVVDFANGNPIPVNGLTVNGLNQVAGDSLQIVDSNTADGIVSFTDVTYTATGANSGTIDLDASRITYTGLEPVIDETNATNRTFTIDSAAVPGDVPVRIADASNGRSIIDSNGTASFENVTFNNPSSTLTVNTGDGSNAITIQALDAAFAAGLTLNAGGGDDTIDASAFNTGLTINAEGGNDVVTGSAFADVINGGDGTDNITAGAGDDVVTGGNDSDTIDAGDGADNVSGEAGDDQITGGAGNDTLGGGTGDDVITGDAGDDEIRGGDNNDNLSGGTGNDDIDGEGGQDTVSGDEGQDTVDGGDDADTVDGGADVDTVRGGAGNDVVTGGAGNDQLEGGADNDTLDGGEGTDNIDGGDGVDRLSGSVTGSQNATLSNTEFDVAGQIDTFTSIEEVIIIGGTGSNVLDAQAYTTGAVTVDAGEGNDTIFGSAGPDFLNGEGGDDLIEAGDGNDTALGGAGRDTINAGAGNDVLSGNAGNDLINGGDGFDSASGGDGDDTLTGGENNDTLDGDIGNDSLLGGGGNDRLIGDSGHDFADGGDGLDRVFGNAGNDTLLGGANRDTVNGGAGRDDIDGGGDKDRLLGGAGGDVLRTDGSGVDTLNGQGSGLDEVRFVGSETADTYEISTFGGTRVQIRSFGGVGGARSRLVRTERVTIDLLGGDDTVTVLDGLTTIAGVGTFTINGGAGNDTIDGGALTNSNFNFVVDGGTGDDAITTGNGNDNVSGGDGNDAITLGSGDDTASGGQGADSINGQAGADVLDGGTENDSILGGSEADVITAGAGDDFVNGNGGADNISGGDGKDILLGEESADTIRGGDDADSIAGGGGNDDIFGDDGNDVIRGEDGEDFIEGGNGNDIISGGLNNDRINGQDGRDTLIGDADNDTLSGGAREDLVVGGRGADIIDGQGTNRDTLVGETGLEGADDDTPDPGDVFDNAAEINNAFVIPTAIFDTLNGF